MDFHLVLLLLPRTIDTPHQQADTVLEKAVELIMFLSTCPWPASATWGIFPTHEPLSFIISQWAAGRTGWDPEVSAKRKLIQTHFRRVKFHAPEICHSIKALMCLRRPRCVRPPRKCNDLWLMQLLKVIVTSSCMNNQLRNTPGYDLKMMTYPSKDWEVFGEKELVVQFCRMCSLTQKIMLVDFATFHNF